MPNLHELLSKLFEHIALASSATLLAILIGVPLGIVIYQHKRWRQPILNVANLMQTIPSLALLAILIPVIGIGVKPTIVALVIYALLPIIRNTFTGLLQVPEDCIETSDALGLTRWQKLTLVALPLAAPTLFAGIRTATAMTIGITTVAAFIGAGGLGDFITQGLSTNNTTLILCGAIPTALLALLSDFFLAKLSNYFTRPNPSIAAKHRHYKWGAVVFFGVIATTAVIAHPPFQHNKNNTVVVGSKNFTEQYILSNLIADMIESHTKLNVVRKFDIGATAVAQQALMTGGIDLYPEYTGTAYINILHQQQRLSAKAMYDVVKRDYKKRYGIDWLPPFHYNSSQTLAVSDAFAQQHHLKTLSDLSSISPTLTAGVPSEFMTGADGYPGFKKTYGMQFHQIKLMSPDLMYAAIQHREVDVIYAMTTDGRVLRYHLRLLRDDKHNNPSYRAAVLIRDGVLKRHPEIQKAIEPLYHLLTLQAIQQLDHAVVVNKKNPAAVAKVFLEQHHLLSRTPTIH